VRHREVERERVRHREVERGDQRGVIREGVEEALHDSHRVCFKSHIFCSAQSQFNPQPAERQSRFLYALSSVFDAHLARYPMPCTANSTYSLLTSSSIADRSSLCGCGRRRGL
jgi:hypothetical protein